MKRIILTLLISIPLLLNSNNRDLETNYPPQFSISFYLGGNSGGPLNEVESIMRTSGFDDDTPPGFFFGGINYPKTSSKSSVLVGMKYHFRSPHTAISLYFSSTNFGIVEGHDTNVGEFSIENKVTCFATVLSLGTQDILHIGLGPALYFTKSCKTEGTLSEGRSEFGDTKIGCLLEAVFRFPARSTWFFEVITQYRILGEDRLGPFYVGNETHSLTYPKKKVRFDHVFIGLGVGVRSSIAKKNTKDS